MKAFLSGALIFLVTSLHAQYYYKDVIGTKESSENIKNYLKNKVLHVALTSYDATNTKSNDFSVTQDFFAAAKTLRTLATTNGGQSVLIATINSNGDVIKTVDSSGIVITITTYTYDKEEHLVLVNSTAADTASRQMEQHIWQWINNKPIRMLRIKNKVDTTYVDFKTDENGNVIEEQETHKNRKALPVYYYYNANNQLTDIVSFSSRAKRLLPQYMFEYSPANQVIQKITVPENNSDYLIWRYQYNAQGLITKEVIYNKQKQVTGKVNYQYSFGS